MIIGLGNDLIDVRRIEDKIEKYGDRFLSRIFTESERERCEKHHVKAGCYAKRFAAKEACSKALGTGIAEGVNWHDMVVHNLASGQPTIELKGRAAEILENRVPEGYEAQINITLTDDYPSAQAVVIISVNKA